MRRPEMDMARGTSAGDGRSGERYKWVHVQRIPFHGAFAGETSRGEDMGGGNANADPEGVGVDAIERALKREARNDR